MIVAGFGFRSAATLASLEDAFAQASVGRDVTVVSSLADKAETDIFQTFARRYSLEAVSVSEASSAQQDTITQSAFSQQARRTGSVAEATALAAAGPNARLLGPRAISEDGMATCAIAEGGQT
ncbi:MAG: cobalamin biosynthesis protein [Boseongicola sp.]|nr:cobalamin biosynthesis protein [Boseongicola sp.]